MSTSKGLSPVAVGYVLTVSAAGLAVVGYSCVTVATGQLDYHWTLLAALTVLSGSATVKLPSVPATISISETFVFTAVLLYGAEVGAVIVALDGLIISCWFSRRRRELHRIAFNLAAPALSIWVSAQLYFAFPGITPLSADAVDLRRILLPLGLFTVSHFVVNSWLIAVAVATETHRRALNIWRNDFLWLSLNYFGGASVAVLLVVYTRQVDFIYLSIIIPLLLILYFTFKIPMARVEDTNKHLVHMNKLYLSTIETLAMAIDAKDQVTHGHIRRVQIYAVGLARALGINDTGLLRAIEASALLHDMGKLAIPEYILNKPGRLSAAEFERMKLHASIGADILSAIEFPYPVVPIVRHHHENWDGSGYPSGLSNIDIPVGARILAVVDCYDALTSDRPYRPSLSHEAATDILLSRRGTMYEPLVVDTFINLYPSLALLSQQTEEPLPAVARLRSVRSGTHRPSSDDESVTAAPSANPPAIAAALDRLQEIVRIVVGQGVLVFAAYDGRLDRLTITFADGDQSSLIGRHFELGQQTIGWVAATRRSATNSDASLDFGLHSSERLAGARFGCVLPLITDSGDLIGVVGLYTPDRLAERLGVTVHAVCLATRPWLSQRAERGANMVLDEATAAAALEPILTAEAKECLQLASITADASSIDLNILSSYLQACDLVVRIAESHLALIRIGGPSFSAAMQTSLARMGLRVRLGGGRTNVKTLSDLIEAVEQGAHPVPQIA